MEQIKKFVMAVTVVSSQLSTLSSSAKPLLRLRRNGESKDPYPLMRTQRQYCVYIVGGIYGRMYIGMTGNLHKRAFEHKSHCIEGFTNDYDVERLTGNPTIRSRKRSIARKN